MSERVGQITSPSTKPHIAPYVSKENAVGKIFVSIFTGGVSDVMANN